MLALLLLLGMTLCCIAAACVSEVAAIYLADDFFTRAWSFALTLVIYHATLVLLVSKILGKRGITLHR